MQHIETIELGSSQSSITFSSIPQDYDDLVVLSYARTDRANFADGIGVLPNNSSANRSRVFLFSDGSGPISGTGTDLRVGTANGSTPTSNTFGSSYCYISNYSSSITKSFSMDAVGENNATTSALELNAGLWNDTSPITSMVLSPTVGNNFVAGSTFSLYGVTAGGDGTVTTA